MIELRVTAREDLGELWLPWCVARDQRTEIIRIDHESDRRDEAMQLRVGDLRDDDVRAALAGQEVGDTRSLTLIGGLADTYTQLAARGLVIVAGGEIFPTPQGPMLHERCHRACGLYEAGLERFELRATVHEMFEPWGVYVHSALRRR